MKKTSEISIENKPVQKPAKHRIINEPQYNKGDSFDGVM